MKKGAQFWLRIAAAVFLGVILFLVPAILFPFGLSLILAILLKPLADLLQRMAVRAGVGRIPYDVWIVVSFVIFAEALYLIAAYVLVPFIKEFKEFAASIPGIIVNIQNAIPRLEAQYQLSSMPPEVKQLIANTLEKIGSYMLQLASVSVSAVFSFAGTIVELIIVPIITFYMIKKGTVFCRGFIGLFPASYTPHLERLFHEIHYVLAAYIRGQLTLCVCMALVVFIGMMALGIPYPLVIGLLAGLVEMIPILGPIIGAVPGTAGTDAGVRRHGQGHPVLYRCTAAGFPSDHAEADGKHHQCASGGDHSGGAGGRSSVRRGRDDDCGADTGRSAGHAEAYVVL